MIHVSRSPLKFFQAESLGRRVKDGFRRGQASLSPEFPRYAEKWSITHRRINFHNPMHRFY